LIPNQAHFGRYDLRLAQNLTAAECQTVATLSEQECRIEVTNALAPIVRLIGEIDVGCAPRVYSLMWQTTGRGKRALVVDLAALEFMDSSGLQILLRLREKLRVEGKKILLISPAPQIQKLFRLTGFDKLFPVFASASQALSFLELEQDL